MTAIAELSQLDIDSAAPTRAMVAAHLRKCILDKELTPGVRLPTTRAMAQLWGTTQSTVQRAVRELSREGLLESTQGSGVFVRERPSNQAIKTVGLYFSLEQFAGAQSTYKGKLVEEVHRVLLERELEVETFYESRPPDLRGEPLPQLMRAVQDRRVQGIVMLCTCIDIKALRERMPVPVAAESLYNSSLFTGSLFGGVIALGMAHLSSQGCKHVSVLSGTDSSSRQQAHCAASAKSAGLSWRPPPASHPIHASSLEESQIDSKLLGYRLFKQFWQQPARPDGLIIHDDVVSMGAVEAIRELEDDIPAEFQLVLYRNKELPYTSPYPAAFIEFSIRTAAASLVGQLAGDHAPPYRSRLQLIPAAQKRG